MLYDDQNEQIHQDKVDQGLPRAWVGEGEGQKRKAIANGYHGFAFERPKYSKIR